MMPLSVITSFYPQALADDARFKKYVLKEYIKLLILDFLAGTAYIRRLTFIGGANLRLVKGIDRFSEDLGFDCKDLALIKGCGLVFSFPVPVDAVLCAMKLSALLSRAKGRDFYDALFLLGQTKPDYGFLSVKCGINNLQELKAAISKKLESVNLQQKKKDFKHLLFNQSSSERTLHFKDFIQTL